MPLSSEVALPEQQKMGRVSSGMHLNLLCSSSPATGSLSTEVLESTKSSVDSAAHEHKPEKPLSLMELVHRVTEELNKSPRDLERVRILMASFDASLGEWRRYAHYHPNRKYTRNLIATDGKNFTLMLLCWNPCMGSPVHNHAESECFMRVVDGQVLESQYETPTENSTDDGSIALVQPLQLRCKAVHVAGCVAYINDSVGLHKIENIFPDRAATLHLYIPPYESCKCYSEESDRVCEAFTTFYSEHGEIVDPHENTSYTAADCSQSGAATNPNCEITH